MTRKPVNNVDPLPQPRRYVTTHDAEGKSIFSSLAEEPEFFTTEKVSYQNFYATYSTPVRLGGDKDLEEYLHPPTPMNITVKNGTVIRIVDVRPGGTSPIHRTSSLDYGVVLEGVVDAVLEDIDTGPTKTLKRGDVIVQRGTLHAWRNTSTTEWARMLFVLVDADPVQAGGKSGVADSGADELNELVALAQKRPV